MAIAEEIKEFVFRKRQWRWLIVAALIALVGHLLEGRQVLQPLIGVTESIEANLKRVQPFQIADIFEQTRRFRGSAGICSDIGSAHGSSCNPQTMALEYAAQNVLATPEVASEVLASADIIGRTVFIFTLASIGLGVVGVIRYRAEFGGGITMWLVLLSVVGFGQWLVGGLFWVLLQLLIVLTMIFGAALSGIAWAILNLFGFYKAAVITLGVVKQADSLNDTADLVTREIAERVGD